MVKLKVTKKAISSTSEKGQKSKKISKTKQKKSQDDSTSEKSSQNLQQSVEKKVEKQPKKAVQKASTSYKGYDAAQLEKFKQMKKDLDKYSLQELQNMLALNNQTKTGIKKDLIEKIADGIVLGQIPRCPICYGGRLKFNYKTGIYNCPGYMEDDHFKFCNKKFQLNEIQRSGWNNSLQVQDIQNAS